MAARLLHHSLGHDPDRSASQAVRSPHRAISEQLGLWLHRSLSLLRSMSWWPPSCSHNDSSIIVAVNDFPSRSLRHLPLRYCNRTIPVQIRQPSLIRTHFNSLAQSRIYRLLIFLN
jgi:hypothetical protein